MKRIIAIVLTIATVMGMMSTTTMAQSNPSEMRAVWISTVYNLDYPKAKGSWAQQQEFIDILDQLKKIGMNTVVVQVRPKGDALYQSRINPWSDVLTGVQGKDPGYDPLAFMIEEAHKRGMQLHAWLNPYRVTTSGTDINQLSANHPARLNPDMLIEHNNALYYNPASAAVKQHIVDTVKEIITQYDVDGIHFDDYFYPSGYPLPAGEGKDGTVANERRQHVNDMIRKVSIAIDSVKPDVSFGVSPGGIWKNTLSDFTGSNTNGSESYYSVYADTRTWIQNEWVDYIVPQIYWETGHKLADYETLVKWWSNEVKGTNVNLYIGQGIYKDVVASEILTQLTINRNTENVKGSFYFSLRDLLGNRQGCKDQITAFNTKYPVTAPSTPEEKPVTPPSISEEKPLTSQEVVGKKGSVMADTLNVRAGARTDRPVVAKVSKNTKVTILDVLGSWYKVKLDNGTIGWASSQYIKVDTTSTGQANKPSTSGGTATGSKTGIVSVEALNMRSGPDTTKSIIKKLSKGTKVTLLESTDKWYKIELADGTKGWVAKEYIQQ